MAETNPFEHKVIPRQTDFRMPADLAEVAIQDVYAALTNHASRNEMIAADITNALASGRSPLLLTGRTEHLGYFANKLSGAARHIFVLKGGMGTKQRRETAAAMAAVRDDESRLILATGSYIGEGFDELVRILCFWPCQSLGREPCSSMWVDCIVSITASASFKSTITWIMRSRC